jgi:hypothetical protein
MKNNPILTILVVLMMSVASTACQNSKAKKDTSVDYKDARSIPALKIPAQK